MKGALAVRPIHCYDTGWMGWLDMRCGEQIRATLYDEELRFMRLATQFDGLSPVDADEAFRLRTEQGCPEEVVQEVCTDIAGFRSLLADHSRKSRGQKKGAWDGVP